jgi:NAD(P)-dependent dehydrogenase (short-subunit alcohol dehydrogenase family)
MFRDEAHHSLLATRYAPLADNGDHPMSSTIAITGAASGIGRGTTAKLLAEGSNVVALDIDEKALAALRKEHAGAGERLETARCDVASADSITEAFAGIGRRHGRLNGLVCSAGLLRIGPLDSMSVTDFDDLFAVNVRGLWLSAKAAMPLLKAASVKGEPARIVFLASIAGLRHKIDSGAYAATKAAVIALTKVLAVESAPYNVLVNAVAPATVDTPMVRPYLDPGSNSRYRTSGTSPLGRIAEPADIAAVISFLLGPQSAYVNGTVIPVDGGTVAAFVPPGTVLRK